MMNRQKIRGGGYYVALDLSKTGPPSLPDAVKIMMAGADWQKGDCYV